MTEARTTEKIPFAKLMASADFQTLTPAMQCWLKLYLGTGNARRATQIAYPQTSAKSRASRACNIQSHPKVKRLLRIAFGVPEPDPLIEDLRCAIRRSIRRDHGLSPDTTAAIKFYEKYSGKKLKAGKANV
jgi:hypothetical protein